MLINTFTSVNPNMSNTRTYEDFHKWLGIKPTRFGVVARMFTENTAQYITEGLLNIFLGDKKKGNQFQSLNTMMFEWDIETNDIKRVAIVDEPVGNGALQTEITMAFEEHYYNMNDTFEIEETRQQFFVVSGPIRRNDKYWEYQVRIIDNSYSATLDDSITYTGQRTMWIGNLFPELHEYGFIKYQSRTSRFRNYISTVRCDDSYSGLYKIHEQMFIKVGKGEGSSKDDKENVYKLDGAQANLMSNFNQAKNGILLLSKGTMDVNGKSTLHDKQNRPIIAGEGMIPQIERYANKYAYNRLTVEVFNHMIAALNDKAKKITGNHYAIVCDEAFWYDCQLALGKFLSENQTDGTYLWSKGANDYINVGAKFNTYNFGGNSVTIMPDKALSRYYGNKGYAMCIDLTADETKNMPAISQFTLKGGNCVFNWVEGAGGKSGLDSGSVASPVHGTKMLVFGYVGCMVANPYRSFILRKNS